MIPDTDPNASPRGCAIRFHLADRVHTDIIAHSDEWISCPGPARNSWKFLRALASERSGEAFGISS